MKQRCTKSATTISNIHGKHTNEKRLLNFHSEVLAERQALEPIHSRNIIKLQITDNHTQFGIHSKSKSF